MPLPPLSVRIASRCACALWRRHGLSWAQGQAPLGALGPRGERTRWPAEVPAPTWQRAGLQHQGEGGWAFYLAPTTGIPSWLVCVLRLAPDQRTILGAQWQDARTARELGEDAAWPAVDLTARQVGVALLADPDQETRELGLRLLAPADPAPGTSAVAALRMDGRPGGGGR